MKPHQFGSCLEFIVKRIRRKEVIKMPKLTRQDWELLRDQYHVAFSGMHEDLFILLLDKVYGQNSPKNNPGELDNADALMIYLAHAEPPISPGG